MRRIAVVALSSLAFACGKAAPLCSEGATECQSGNQVWVCSGGAWAYTQTCMSPATCSNGACVGGCTDGTTECQGNDVYVCSGGVFALQTTCTATQTCTGGACVDNAACTDGQYECASDTDVALCTGGRWVLDSKCDPGYECSNGACGCVTGAVACVGNDIYTCSGGAFAYTATCDGSGGVCEAGQCVAASVCTNGALSCDQGNQIVCNGGAWTVMQACPSGCLNGQCVTACTAGSYECVNNDVYFCDNSGNWAYSYTCVNGYVCGGAGVCQAQCTSGAFDCSGNDVYACQGGAWVYQQTCSTAEYCSQGVCVAASTCGTDQTACTSSENCAAGFVCLETSGYACGTTTSTGCTCSYNVCGISGNTCQSSLDCCSGYACAGNYCAPGGRASADVCHGGTDCASGTCNIVSSACYGNCQ